MFNFESPTDIKRLSNTVWDAYKRLEKFREKRTELVKDLTADWSIDDVGFGDERKMPINNLSLMVSIYLMKLAGTNPKVVLPTAKEELLPFVADLESIVNKELDSMNFDQSVRRWVLEAIFCVGVLKTGLTDGDPVELIPGEPQPSQDYFAEVIDFDNFVYDVDASDWSKITFIGDRYRIDYDDAMRSNMDSQAKRQLFVSDDEAGEETEQPTREVMLDDWGSDVNDERMRRTAWVWDVCLPEDGIVVTIPYKRGVGRALKVVEWEGPKNTPYHVLYFNDIPGSTMPLPPGQTIKSINKAINALYVKLIEQARRQKNINLGRTGEKADAEKVRNAQDGELILVESPETVTPVNFPGPSAENQALAIHLDDRFSRLAGNIDAMGGLGPQSDTASQDQMIGSQVGEQVYKMSQIVTARTADVMEDFIYHIWEDPVRTYTAIRDVTDEIKVEAVIEPWNRPGEWGDFDIKIEPYSMVYRAPNQRVREIRSVMLELVIPILPVLQQQGIGLNIQRLLEYLSKYMDLPELMNILEFAAPPMLGDGNATTKASTSHRTYERVNRPGATRQGNDRTMQQLLSGGNPQPSQQAALGRPTGA